MPGDLPPVGAPPGYTTCNVYRANVQTTHLVALDDEGRNGGRPTVCGLTRFGRRDPDTYVEIEPPDLPGWSMGRGGVFGPGVAQVPCEACFAAADEIAEVLDAD